jgi:rhodanese-related sulfurtransferase
MKKIVFITIEKLLEMLVNKEKLKIVEVLSEEQFKEGHLPGAINIPLNKINSLATKHLKKNETIIVYCSSYSCHASTMATRLLLDLGYEKTVDFKAGKRGWKHSGLELEK